MQRNQLNEKDIEILVKKYSKNKEYPILENIDENTISAYFGEFEGYLEYEQISKIESEIISKISGLNVSTQIDCGLSLSIDFSPINTSVLDIKQYEKLIEKACKVIKEILIDNGITEENLQIRYNKDANSCENT